MLTENINKLLEDQKQIQTKFQEECKVLLNELVKGYFEKYPNLKVIQWNQYAPYFNDGDACVFHANPPTFSTVDELGRWGSYEGVDEIKEPDFIWDAYSMTADGNITEEMEKDFKDFSKFIQDDNVERVLESMFGDCQVRCTKDGIESQYIDHD